MGNERPKALTLSKRRVRVKRRDTALEKSVMTSWRERTKGKEQEKDTVEERIFTIVQNVLFLYFCQQSRREKTVSRQNFSSTVVGFFCSLNNIQKTLWVLYGVLPTITPWIYYPFKP